MDYAIQKAVELGVAWIQPLTTQRSVVRLDRRRGAAKRAHWQSVAASACEQCGRNRIPLVHDVRELVQWIDTAPSNSLKLALTPHEGRGLDAFAPPRGPVVLLVGPEGGFAPPELEAASVGGFRAITMGPRVLRTETAAVAALTAVQVLWGDF